MVESMKAVIDIDDTICRTINRDYANSIPFVEVIEKINNLHDVQGFEIELYTSRGMVSCNGDINKAIAKNKEILEEWLKKNNVHYDKLTFGKPISDFYVDDKCFSLKEFMSESFYELSGGSGKKVYKMGNVVKKEFGSDKEREEFQDWEYVNKGFCKTPHIISYLYNAAYMDFIDGELLKDNVSLNDVADVARIIDEFSNHRYNSFDASKMVSVLAENYSSDVEMNYIIDFCLDKLKGMFGILNENASFCHGDCTLSNIIKSNDEFWFIDQRFDKDASSYLLDYAKLKMSLDNYEYRFNLSKDIVKQYIRSWFENYLLIYGIYDVVTILELMYICRLYRYKSKDEKDIVKEFAKELIANNGELFEGFEA